MHGEPTWGYLADGLSGVDALKPKPAMLAVAMRDQAVPPALMIADFTALWPGGPVVKLANAGHYCQEDAPETLVALVHQFMQMTR